MHALFTAIDFLRLPLLGVVVFLALYFAWQAVVNRRERTFLWVAGWCVDAGLLIVARHLQLSADEPREAVRVAQLVLTAALLFAPLGLGLSAALSERALPRAFRLALIGTLIPVLVHLTTPLFTSQTTHIMVDALGRELGVALKTRVTLALVAYIVVIAGACGLILRDGVASTERGPRRLVIAASVLLVFCGANDLLGIRGVIDTIFMLEFGAAAIAIAAAYLVAVRSRHYLTAVEASGERKSLMVERIIEAQEDERRRIARELHDTAGQSLTSLLLNLRAPPDASADQLQERMGELRELTRGTLDEIRQVARGLHPLVLDELGFEEALRSHAADFSKSYGIAVDVHVNGMKGRPRLARPIEIQLYRVAQEALTNVARHAEAESVALVLVRDERRVKLIIEDDGRGFDLATVVTRADSLGLQGMQERAQLCGGELTIETEPGNGTALHVRIPMNIGVE